MTREKATDLVNDLIEAFHDFDNNPGRKSYREDYEAIRRSVINHLTDAPSPQATAALPEAK